MRWIRGQFFIIFDHINLFGQEMREYMINFIGLIEYEKRKTVCLPFDCTKKVFDFEAITGGGSHLSNRC